MTDISLSRSSPSKDGSAAAASGLTLGVDIGGTKISAGVVTSSGEVLRYERRPMPKVVDEPSTTTMVDELVDWVVTAWCDEQPTLTAVDVAASPARKKARRASRATAA